MPIQLQLESRGTVTIPGTTAMIGSGPGCDLVINLHHIQPEHAQIRRMLGKWLVESRGDWLIQVDDDVPARKGWLTNGATIRLSEQGPLVTFSEAGEDELPDVTFDEFSGEEIAPTGKPPRPPGKPPRPPGQTPPSAVPKKPVAQNPPSATPSKKTVAQNPPAKSPTPQKKTAAENPTPQKKTVAENPPATPAAQKKTVKKVVKKVAATPPPEQPPQPKPAQPGGFDVLAFLMGGDEKPAKPASPPAQSTPPQPPSKPGGLRSVPTPPGLNSEPPAAGKTATPPEKKPPAAEKPPEKKAPEKSGPAKCGRCNVPLRPTGQCPACGRQY